MALYCEMASLVTESDVEQKFIYPFLKTSAPIGLGLKDAEILTKQVLRRKIIDKGQKQKYYFPDYLITIRGIPILVVEAKSPDEPLTNGYFEARLYAQEVNASFPHKVNACQYVIASNGYETWAGYADQAEPKLRLKYDDFSAEHKLFCELIAFCSREVLVTLADRNYAESRGNAWFNSPVSQLGGKRVQNEEMVENSFGRTLVFENRTLFDPETEYDRTVIVRNAYVSSSKLNAKDLVNYLVEYRKEYPIDSRELLSEQEIILPFDLGISLHAIEQWIQADAYISATIDKIERFKVGMHIDACIVSKSNGGLVCTIAGEEIKGFTSIMERKYLLPNAVYADANIGDIIKCQIIEYDIEHRSFQLRYVNRGEIKMS